MDVSDVLSDRYRIDREIGAGGMATVYLAEDLKHHRRVALKVLRPELGAVLGPERFLSEINVTANLQHPHLLPLFDSGEAEGLLFYVMPYIEGESLRVRLERERQLPVDEAVRIAVAVSSALDYAHRHGVIHRDLKPENILLHEGQPLVTDFGIALAVSKAGGARVTQTGLSLGTPQYMSPEQATGDRVIDARSDVYSLGVVLYEMLTGDPPYRGSTTQAIIARALTEKPPSARVYRDSVPEHVDTAIQRALAKLPADRFASAGELADVLTGQRVPSTAAAVARSATAPVEDAFVLWLPRRFRSRLRAALPWGTAAAAVLSAGAIAVIPREQPVTGWPTLFPVVFSDIVEAVTPSGNTFAISADGSQLAFVGSAAGVSGLFVRRMDALEARFLPGTEGASGPVFSPDGNWLAFQENAEIKKVPATGGAPITLADSGVAGEHLSWGDRGDLLYGWGPTLWRVPADGGDPALLATVDSARGHVRYGRPSMLPGSRAALITIWKTGDLAGAELGLVRLRDGRVIELGVPGTAPQYMRSGHILFGRADGSLFAAPFSASRLKLTGPPVPVLQDVLVKVGGAMELVVSGSGTLVYKSVMSGTSRRAVVVTRSGAATPMGVDSLYVAHPSVSPDGRRVAMTVLDGTGGGDIWIKDRVNGSFSRLTTDGTSERAVWTPDGRQIAFWNRAAAATGAMRVQPWDGSRVSEILTDDPPNVTNVSFGPPGSFIAARQNSPPNADILLAPVDSPQALRPLLATPANEMLPRVSPTGRLLAYVTDETGRREVYVRRLPGPAGRIQVSVSGGDEPVWAPNGRELFFRSPTHLMAALITEDPELEVLRRDTLFRDMYVLDIFSGGYDVFPSGTEFVFLENLRSQNTAFLGIANFPAYLQQRMRAR